MLAACSRSLIVVNSARSCDFYWFIVLNNCFINDIYLLANAAFCSAIADWLSIALSDFIFASLANKKLLSSNSKMRFYFSRMIS